MVLTFLGLFLSTLWLGLCGWYVERTIGFAQIGLFMPDELGQVLSGVFLPLAFMWVLIAYANLAGRVRALEQGGSDTTEEAVPRSEPSVGPKAAAARGLEGDDEHLPTLRIAADHRGH